MKKVLSILLCTVMLLSSVSAFASEKVYTVQLDLSNKSPLGEFHGWGTSLCWWGHHMGENLTEAQLENVVKALYDEKEGLGLNIARYNIGGGDDPSHHHQREFDGRDMPGITDKDGNWNLENDKGQLLTLQLCVKYGADILEAFSNSPPYYMTESGCSSGNHDPNKNNLPNDKFDDFAEYLAEAVLRIQKEYGVKFDTLEPFNESDTNFWGYEGWQEGCHFDVTDHSRLIMEVRKSLDKRNLNDVNVSAADEHSIWRMGENIKNVYTKEAVDTITQINAHSYSVGDYNHLKSAAIEVNKPLYMTEVDGDGTLGGREAGSMAPALWFSQKLTDDIRGLEPNAWVMWQAAAMGYEGEMKDTGYWNILSYDKEKSIVNKYKKYYAYMQYTKFIRPGDTLVKTDYNNVVCAINEKLGKVVFVVTNTDTADKTYNFSLSNLGAKVSGAEVYVTDKTKDCELVSTEYGNVCVPAHSVVTVVLNADITNKSINLKEKNNSVSALVGETLEFEVTDENGGKITGKAVPESVQCVREGEITVTAEHDGLKDSISVTVVAPGSKVRIIGSGSERALKVRGNDVIITDRTHDASQVWEIEKHNDYYAFKNEKTGKYLSTENFLTTGKMNDKALWKLEKDKGLYRIINKATGDSIDVYNHATEKGSQVGVYGGYYATANQLFYFELCEPKTEVETEFVADAVKLSGTPFGSKPWDADENVTFDKAWDGNVETFFHADRDADRTGYTGLDLGETHLPFNKIVLNSRPGFEYRGYNATISGSNELNGEYEVIYTFKSKDFTRHEEATVFLEKDVNYRYIKYETPLGGYCNVGDITLMYDFGTPKTEIVADQKNYDIMLNVQAKAESAIVSYYEEGVLKKVDVVDADNNLVISVANIYDMRVQLVGKNNVLIASYYIKKY